MNDQVNPSHSLEIYLLGKFAVIYKDALVPELNTPRLQSLLAYLALHSDAPQSRKALAFRLWPESNEEQALTNLRKQLKFLRDALPDADQLLVGDRQTIGWVAPTTIYCDVTEFRKLLSTNTTSNDSIPSLKHALELYQGELLLGCYDEWLLPVREELQQLYLTALERLSTLHEGQRNYDDAIQTSQQLLRLDPLHEATYRRLIRLYALNEDRAAALRTYHTCVTQLREELGVDPDEETQAVYERLLDGAALMPVQPELAAYAPFVGRHQEWQTLQRRWRLATPNQPQFVLIAGEAGIGKTRLAEELLNWAHHQGFCTVRSRCYAAEGRLTYAPIIEWLRSEPLRSQRRKIASTWLTELARLLPEILSENPTIPAPEPITQSAQRHHLFEAVSRALLASDQPLLLLVDDLQWCDKESLELLHFLLRNAATLRQTKLLLMGTARLPDEVDLNHPLYELLNPLRGSDSLTQIDLARLSVSETSELASQMAERQLDDHALKQLFADTAGNPLFVVETMRANDSKLSGNGDRNGSALPYFEVGEELLRQLPPKVLAVIQSRLTQLSAAAQELCEWAAIIGRAFTLDLLVGASKMAQDKAVSALEELWQRRLIREQGSDAYDFSHDRIRDVTAARVSRVRRKYLHRCVAETLENQSSNHLDSVAAQLANHFSAAGVSEKAISYYQRSAEVALHVYANQEAINYLNAALILLHTLPAGRTRDEREYRLLISLGPPLVIVKGHGSEELCDNYLFALKLAEELNYPRDPAILRVLAIHYLAHRKFDLVYQYGTELLQFAQMNGQIVDAFLYVEVSYTLGVTSFWQGHFAQSRYYLEQAVTFYDPQQHERHIAHFGQDPGVACLSRLAWALWYLGYPEQAVQRIRQGFDLAYRLKHPFSIEYVLTWIKWLSYDMRDQVITTEVNELATAQELQPAIPTLIQPLQAVIHGKNLVESGQITEGIKQIHAGTEMAALNRYEFMYKLHFQTILAHVLLRLGDYVRAQEALDQAITHVATYADRYYLAELYRLKGEISLLEDKPHEVAERYFQQALAISHGQEAKSLELRAAMSVAHLWERQGKRNEARELLAQVYHWFTEGFDTPDLQEAKALLRRLESV